MAAIRTTDGTLVLAQREGAFLTDEYAEASAAERNERAEAMGLTVRYEATDENISKN